MFAAMMSTVLPSIFPWLNSSTPFLLIDQYEQNQVIRFHRFGAFIVGILPAEYGDCGGQVPYVPDVDLKVISAADRLRRRVGFRNVFIPNDLEG